MEYKNEFIIVRNSKIHGRGIFAKSKIPKGTEIIEYIGDKITKEKSDLRFQKTLEKAEKDKTQGEIYLFELNTTHDIDGNVENNIAKYINHSCEPNCETEIIDKKEIWIVAKKNIKEGEELSFNYGLGFEEYTDYPCKCNTKSCIGFILDEKHWPKLNKF